MFDQQLSMKVVLLLVGAFAIVSWRLFIAANHARHNRPVGDWFTKSRMKAGEFRSTRWN